MGDVLRELIARLVAWVNERVSALVASVIAAVGAFLAGLGLELPAGWGDSAEVAVAGVILAAVGFGVAWLLGRVGLDENGTF